MLGSNIVVTPRTAVCNLAKSVLSSPLLLTSLLTACLAVPSFAQHAISISADSGSAFPWEGSRPSANGTVNTGNGNKLTSLPLVGWTAKGGMPVDITLYHNSQGSHNSELGQKFSWTYDIYLAVDAMTGDVTVNWGNGLSYPFTKSGSTYSAPTGIYDTFTSTISGGNIVAYDLTTTSQIKYHFTNPNATGWYISTISDRNSNTITVNHNGSDYVTSVVDPTSRTVSIAYDGNNRISTITDPQSRVWTITYSSGKLAQVSWPAVSGSTYTDQFSYNAAYDITTHTDKRGHNFTATYNSDDSLATETDACSNTISYSYTSGQTVITDANSHTMNHNYSGGELASIDDALSKTVTYRYNASKQVDRVTDQFGKQTFYTFDAYGNRLTVQDPNSHTTTWTYTAKNDVASVVTPLGYQTIYTYDGNGNLTKVEDKDNNSTLLSTVNYTRNGDGTMATKVDDNSHTTTYGYDSNGHLTSVTTPLSKVTSWTVNTLGVITSRVSAASQTTSYTLDGWNRVTTTTYPSGTNPTFSYDANSNLTGWTDAWATWARTYDNDNRILTESKGGTTEIAYAYDGSGQKGLLSTTTDWNSRVITYAYTNRNQLYTVNESSNTATYSYDDAGRETGITNLNGTTVAKVYDDAGLLTSITNKTGGGTTLSSFVYTYSNDDQRLTSTELDGSVVSFGYDANHRLISEGRTTTNAYSYSYGLDGMGNRTSKTVSGTTTNYTYDNDDRLTAVGTDTYSWTNNGELDSKTVGGVTNAFAYTFEGMIDYYNTGGTHIADFGYDALGRRLFRNIGGVTTRFYYDQFGHVLLETQAGVVTATYAHGNELLRKDGEYPLFDGQGNERTVTNSGQSVTGTINYDAFGNTVGSTGSSASSFMYGATSGYQNNGDAGLTYISARYYDSAVGRFTTRDTVLTEHPYLYCDHDPVNNLDPGGHEWKWVKWLIERGKDLITLRGDPGGNPYIPVVKTYFKVGFILAGAIAVIDRHFHSPKRRGHDGMSSGRGKAGSGHDLDAFSRDIETEGTRPH